MHLVAKDSYINYDTITNRISSSSRSYVNHLCFSRDLFVVDRPALIQWEHENQTQTLIVYNILKKIILTARHTLTVP